MGKWWSHNDQTSRSISSDNSQAGIRNIVTYYVLGIKSTTLMLSLPFYFKPYSSTFPARSLGSSPANSVIEH